MSEQAATSELVGWEPFRGIDTIMAAVKPALVAAGVFFVPNVTASSAEEVLIGQKQTRMRFVTLTVRFDIYGPDGSYIECTTVGEAMDSGDKAANKAMSAAFKYALMQVLCISDAGADDADHSSPELGEKVQTWTLAQTKIEVAVQLEETLKIPHDEAVKLARLAWERLGDDKRPAIPADEAQELISACVAEAVNEHQFDEATS